MRFFVSRYGFLVFLFTLAVFRLDKLAVYFRRFYFVRAKPTIQEKCDSYGKERFVQTIVSLAWAGFGATFGPLVIFSLFWKRINRAGAIAGMIGGGAMVFIQKLGIAKLGGVFAMYELLPAFIFSSICIVVVSLLTAPPSKEIEEDFEAVRNGESA